MSDQLINRMLRPIKNGTVYYVFIMTLGFMIIISAAIPIMDVIALIRVDPMNTILLMLNALANPRVLLVCIVCVSIVILTIDALRTPINRWYVVKILMVYICCAIAEYVGYLAYQRISAYVQVSVITPVHLWDMPLLISEVRQLPGELSKLLVCWAASFTALALIYIYSTYYRKHTNNSLGDAHFATTGEINKAGFFDRVGCIVGKKFGVPLKAGGHEHILLFAPAGSGKSTSIAIPNLLTWEQSCVVNDTKYELFELTSEHRRARLANQVYLWAPTRTDGKTHRYNPLQFISKDQYKRISEIQLMSHVFIPNGQGEPIWYQSSRELFLALVLYLLDTPSCTTTFAELYKLSKQYKFNTWLTDLVENTQHYDPEFYRNASSYLNSAEKTRASILKTFTGYLEIFANPIINAATSDSDFDLRDLRRKKMTIYIGFPDNEKEIISPLLTIFWQQLIAYMTEKLPDVKDEPYTALCIMDEFSTLGRIVNLKNSLKILRAYHVRMLIIVQYLAQTLEIYSPAEAEAFKNIKTKICFALDSNEDAQYVSKLLGMQTKKITNHSHTNTSNSSNVTKTIQLQSVPLMRPEELQRMSDNDAIIIRTGHPPIKAKKYRWYEQKDLRQLPSGAVEVPRQKPMTIPFEQALGDGDDESALDEEEKMLAESLHNEQRLQDLELEKIEIQAKVFTEIVAAAIKDS